MTPQERQMIDDLFDRLAKLETAPRDPEAEHAIIDGLRRAPNAVYALVQTALVQDEALKRADAKIRELSGEGQPHRRKAAASSTACAMRSRAMCARRCRACIRRPPPPAPADPIRAGIRAAPRRAHRTMKAARSRATRQAMPRSAPSPGLFGGGSSFLGTAAASAAGMIGGSLLLNSISSMFGHHGSAFGSYNDAPPTSSPWDNSAAGSNLAQDAGINDIGNQQSAVGDQQAAGLFDNPNDPGNADVGNDFGDDLGGDAGDGGDFGGSDMRLMRPRQRSIGSPPMARRNSMSRACGTRPSAVASA